MEFDPVLGLTAPNDVIGVDAGPDGAEIAGGGTAPGDKVSGRRPPLPIDPCALCAIAGPATDPAIRHAIAAARRGLDLFIGSSFRGSSGNAYRFPCCPRS
jgi:hypothetical protein